MITLIYDPLQIVSGSEAPLRGEALQNVNIIKDCHLVIQDDTISGFIKKGDPLPSIIDCFINCSGKTIVPGFIDSHTHLVWGGYREEEFEMRATGIPYEVIARSGGGIANTVEKTRKASFHQLYSASRARLNRMIKNGTTSFEIKSGYGLNLNYELKQLKVIARLKREFPVTIKSTFLGAHDIPHEYRDKREEYIDTIINEMLPYIKEHDLADFVDVFCDTIAFSNAETEKIILKALDLGFDIRLHADEIENTEGSSLAVKHKALSADHLIKISDEGINAMSSSETVANLLPGTSFYLRKTFAPARKMIEKGCIIAISTDLNPGSSVLERMPIAMFLGVWGYGLTINEAFNASTANGAFSMRIFQERGILKEGKKADLLILDCDNYKHIVYNYSANLVEKVMINGKIYNE